MKKNKDREKDREYKPYKAGSIWKVLLKFSLLFLASLIIGYLLWFFFKNNLDFKQTGKKLYSDAQKSKINIFKWLGWKWNIILFLGFFFYGIFRQFKFWALIKGYWERKKLIEFCETVHMAIVSNDIGKGKTLLLSILARKLPHGIKKIGFLSNVPDAELLSYNDINFDEPIKQKENYWLPKYFFLDETNFWIEGTDYMSNRYYHKGVAWLLQIARHHRIHLWISATRDNHVWVNIRQIANYFVKLSGLRPLSEFGRFKFYTLWVDFYNQSWELQHTFKICVDSLDFKLYDSYWLKGTSAFRPILSEAKYNYIGE